MCPESDLLTEAALQKLLPDDCLIGSRIIFHEQTGSTNNDAFCLAEAGAAEGTVVIADCQQSGKGRLGRQWSSPAGVNLYCSAILRPPIMSHEAAQLTFVSALAVANAIEKSTGLEPAIKWPNDILLNNKKVAGLLNEMSANGDKVGFVILGTGVNINMTAEQFPADLRSPSTSLLLATDHKVSRTAFTACFLQELSLACKQYLKAGFEPVRRAWSKRCNAFGRSITVSNGGAVLHGFFDGIDYDGALLLRRDNGDVERVVSGDVTVNIT